MNTLRILALLLLPVAVSGQSWELRISTLEDEGLVTGIEDANGDFVLCGGIGNSLVNDFDPYLMKISSSGDTILSKRLNDTSAFSMDGSVGIVEQDDGYLIFGYIYPDSVNPGKIAVLKTDFNFEQMWTKQYGSPYYSEILRSVKVNKDSTIMGIGTADADTSADLDVFIYKFSPQGDSLSSNYLQFPPPFPWQQFGYDIIQRDSGYKIIGGPGTDYIINLDSNLDTLSYIMLDTVPENSPLFRYLGNNSALRWLNDSVYMAYGRASDIIGEWGQNARGTAVVYLSADDSMLFARVFGKPDTSDWEVYYGLDLLYPSATYAGSTSPFYDTTGTIWQTHQNWYNLNKLDEAGNVLWEKYYGGNAFNILMGVIATRDSGCLMVGTSYDWQTANGLERDIWIVKVGPDGLLVSANETMQLPEATYKIYPNPASNYFYLQGSFALPAALELYDMMGRQVFRQPVTSNRQQVDVSKLAGGLYVYRLVSKGREARGKIILE